MARLCPLFSSSSGNSIYIGASGSAILVDVGANAKQTCLALERMGLSPTDIDAIFITHEHTDHVQGLRVFASKFGIDVYASEGTLQGLDEKGMLNGKFRYFVMPKEGVEISNGLTVKANPISHDCREGLCYTIFTGDGRRASVVTDLGQMTDEVKSFISGSDFVVIESNHDVKMLENGPYPYYLKRRILSEYGHLSNDTCAKAVVDLLNTGTTYFMLAHLSRENNYPDLAYQSSFSALTEIGAKQGQDFILSVAPINCPDKITVF